VTSKGEVAEDQSAEDNGEFQISDLNVDAIFRGGDLEVGIEALGIFSLRIGHAAPFCRRTVDFLRRYVAS
jgi:hypothetical protein